MIRHRWFTWAQSSPQLRAPPATTTCRRKFLGTTRVTSRPFRRPDGRSSWSSSTRIDWAAAQWLPSCGLEKQYEGRIDFIYLNVAEAQNDSAKRAFGFRATPHFFFATAKGETRAPVQGVVPEDSVRRALDRLLTDPK